MLVVAPLVSSQQNVMDPLAQKIAESVRQSKKRSVLVFDFYGPGSTVTPLGAQLSKDLTASLSKAGEKIVIENSAVVAELMRKNGMAPEAIDDPETVIWLAKQIHVDIAIVGELSIDGDKLKTETRAYRTDTATRIAEFGFVLPVTDAMRAGLNPPSESKPLESSPPLPFAETKGYTNPSCLYCPRATMAQEAVDHKQEGTVLLVVIIGTNGKASDIKVAKGLPYGLSENAIDAVKVWIFKPARDSNGKPQAVRQAIEVKFHLY